MKVNEVIRVIKNDGWFLHRNGANHDVYKHPLKNGFVIVPRHGAKELKKKTELSILKSAGLK
ncbi:type II toxin-antitoxin system HicA family toxin [Elizabethkingia anophelis]|nr:type II toxin-antitoxin system HicA family toxin [Elizabethkingia anophelis]MCT4261633.1 type II toxin-antitoxin system HicA family toxin [Elizabethkingia anophelis]MCT4330970.1 type II toxin-antitoxin system HicA family toxin [Elizabethkingia anophelis]